MFNEEHDYDTDIILSYVKQFADDKLGDSYIIPFELTSKQRSIVHEYVKANVTGVTTESIILKSSPNKMIRLIRCDSDLNNSDQMREPTTDEVDMFIRFSGAPIPCPHNEYISYFVNLYDSMFNTIDQWELFNKEIQYLPIKKEAADAMKQIHIAIAQNTDYKTMMRTDFKKPKDISKKHIYTISGIGKHFLSIDIRMANFTMLRKYCESVFRPDVTDMTNTNNMNNVVDNTDEQRLLSWYQFVKKFTKSDFIAKSKHFREVCFGDLGFAGKANILQSIYMDDIHNKVLDWAQKSN